MTTPLKRGPVVLVTTVGAARGARAAAMALALAASKPERAAMLVDLGKGRVLRPSLIATAGARALEERLRAHLPDAPVASRGWICQLSLPPGSEGIAQAVAALPLVRETAGVIHVPPALMQAALAEPRLRVSAVLLRSDLAKARALTALTVSDLMARDVQVAVQKQPPSWLAARSLALGVSLPGSQLFSQRVIGRLLADSGPSKSGVT